jgi:hypothetical protein
VPSRPDSWHSISTFVVAGGAWATRASSAFLTDVVPEKRRALAAFPLSLFYFSISMMVFIQTLTPSTPLPSIVPMDAVRSG